MNDDQMDEMLIQGVRDYNAPSADTPREEMWRRIQEGRAEARRAAPGVVPIDSHRRRRWVAPSLAAAAVVILAAGIAIGRSFDRIGAHAAPVVASTATSRSDTTATTGAKAPDTSVAELVRKAHDETKKNDEHVRALASAEHVTAPGAQAPSNGAAATGGNTSGNASGNTRGNAGLMPNQSLAYRLVVLQHLAGSEAMITSFRSSARNGQLDAELSSWSRELLSTTRLLESSQASTDPVMKRLLDDLDLVISQIVQYTSKGTTNPEELDLIEQSINKRGVMSKLRSTIPSRNLPAGT